MEQNPNHQHGNPHEITAVANVNEDSPSSTIPATPAPQPSSGSSFWKIWQWVGGVITSVYQWAKTPSGRRWLKWLIYPVLVSIVSGFIGHNVYQPTKPHIVLVQNVTFGSNACDGKAPDASSLLVWVNLAPSYTLCQGMQFKNPTVFYDRDEGDKTDSGNIAAFIKSNPGIYTVIASGQRNTLTSDYPNILCLFQKGERVAGPPYCDGYPIAPGSQP